MDNKCNNDKIISKSLRTLLLFDGISELSIAPIISFFPELIASFRVTLFPPAIEEIPLEISYAMISGGELAKRLAYVYYPLSLIPFSFMSFSMISENRVSKISLLSKTIYHTGVALSTCYYSTNFFATTVTSLFHGPLAVAFGLYTFYYSPKSPYGLSFLGNGSIFKPTWFFNFGSCNCKCGKSCGCCKCGSDCNCTPSCTCCKCGPDCKCGDKEESSCCKEESSCCKVESSSCCKPGSGETKQYGCKYGKKCGCCKCGADCKCTPNCTCCKCGESCSCGESGKESTNEGYKEIIKEGTKEGSKGEPKIKTTTS